MTDETPAFPDVSGRAKGELSPERWDLRWQDADTPWDMGHASPPFVSTLASGVLGDPVGKRALVPGCGAGHEVRMLAAAGYAPTGADFSEAAVAHARELAAAQDSTATFEVADLFALPDSLKGVDLVLEHTCFCAIDPSRRDDYVRAVAEALVPGGRLMGLFFIIEPEEGPPFGATEAEIRHRFGEAFTIDVARTPTDSHEARQGREMLFLMTRRG